MTDNNDGEEAPGRIDWYALEEKDAGICETCGEKVIGRGDETYPDDSLIVGHAPCLTDERRDELDTENERMADDLERSEFERQVWEDRQGVE